MMSSALPMRTHTYQNHVFDSTYWDLLRSPAR